jgi:metal-sulfur cluster biosynthetic enzyme
MLEIPGTSGNFEFRLEVQTYADDNRNVTIYLLISIPVLLIAVLILAVRRQSSVTRSITEEERAQDVRVLEESTRKMDATVAEELAKKARDPRLASMTQEDLVFEVLKECYDPEIPLNIVDLGLIYEVKVLPDAVNIRMSMTSPMCPSHVAIREDARTKLADAGFPNPQIEVVWEPAWSPQRISEAGRKKLGI